MTLDLATVLKAVKGWPEADRRELRKRLARRAADDGPAPTPELLAELDRRVADSEADPGDVVTWDEIMTHVWRQR